MINDEEFNKKRDRVHQAYMTARRILEDFDKALEAAEEEDKSFREMFEKAYSVRYTRMFK